MSDEIKKINGGQLLLDTGLLFQINRDILHPLGLALAVEVNEVTKEVRISDDMWDYRDDPEGLIYDPQTLFSGTQKLDKFYSEFGTEKIQQRYDTLGYVSQRIIDVDATNK